MLINQIITDGSDSGSPKKRKVVVRTRRQRVNDPKINENEENLEEKSPEKEIKKVETSIISRLSPQQKRVIRFVDKKEEISKNYTKKETFLTCKIEREHVHKINGTRTYFKYTEENSEAHFIAKAKFESSEEIPINEGNEIHLRSKSFYAKLVSKNQRSLFSLFMGEDEIPVEDIQFMLSRASYEGPRRMSVFIYPDESNGTGELTLESKNATEMPNFGKMYRVVSVKNALLAPVGEEESMISIRKTGEDTIEIDTIIDMSSVQLFAIGIASFLGKTQ